MAGPVDTGAYRGMGDNFVLIQRLVFGSCDASEHHALQISSVSASGGITHLVRIGRLLSEDWKFFLDIEWDVGYLINRGSEQCSEPNRLSVPTFEII
jgi:hypothetical protein